MYFIMEKVNNEKCAVSLVTVFLAISASHARAQLQFPLDLSFGCGHYTACEIETKCITTIK